MLYRQSKKEWLKVCNLLFNQVQAFNWVMYSISSGSTFPSLKITLFLCFQIHHTIATHISFHPSFVSGLNETLQNWTLYYYVVQIEYLPTSNTHFTPKTQFDTRKRVATLFSRINIMDKSGAIRDHMITKVRNTKL